MKQYVYTNEEHFQDQLMEPFLQLQIQRHHLEMDDIYLNKRNVYKECKRNFTNPSMYDLSARKVLSKRSPSPD